MNYTILDAHIKYFQENGYIEFENTISTQTLEKLKSELEKKSLLQLSSLEESRDLFRKSEVIKKIAFNKTISFILKNLTKRQNLRLVFDQLLVSQEKNPFNQIFSLDSISSFQGLIGGIIINLDPKSFILNSLNKKNISIFIKSSFPINIKNIFLDSDVFLLIAYGEFKTIYKKNLQDPYSNYLKQFGYNFGDVLKDNLHPVVF